MVSSMRLLPLQCPDYDNLDLLRLELPGEEVIVLAEQHAVQNARAVEKHGVRHVVMAVLIRGEHVDAPRP